MIVHFIIYFFLFDDLIQMSKPKKTTTWRGFARPWARWSSPTTSGEISSDVAERFDFLYGKIFGDAIFTWRIGVEFRYYLMI